MKVSKYSSFSDEQLFNLIENGDKIAFTEAYNKYHRLLYSVSYRYLMDREKAEEAVQYVFVRLWEYRSDLNIGISLKNYLFTMTKNYVLNIIRNENSMTEKQYELAQRASEFADDFVEKFENRERMDIFYKALDKLPEQKREICLLKVREELSNKEIAERMNLSVNTIKTHYSEALKLLRIHLKKMLMIILFLILLGVMGV
ncbi:RNA polymerase sigma factor [Bacteroides sp. ET336]|uniref:RNA polymerase sigma factor n=1 Tax=Bacteroides sp. ET336 TaxID=2972459 RepID=UPI0021ACD1A1|nr:RNA polymerase sigma-70 factor [Bacteroides sp. ET336]MCR8892818.1 RNA polymerase sigma-70 factor [Bacteroides sp. ET336]MDN0057315.1 RNA polymerase sigma-70 factor [Bacteroides caecigallinarum]MDN0071162.1 RNA polymerase sigma-70 factor [Bacteroides caecigallinarum]